MRFNHGLGDCAYFAHQIPLYLRRGWQVMVACQREKEVLFRAAGGLIALEPDGARPVLWLEGQQPTEALCSDNWWRWSKMARNLSLDPMPDVGHPADLWEEYCAVTLDARPFLPAAETDAIGRYVACIAGPRIVLHTHGVTHGDRKNMPAELVREICRELLRSTEATVLLLDGENRVSPPPHWRIRHLAHDFGRLSTEGLLALLAGVDLIVGVDSGPLHAARFTPTPAIGVWMGNGSPATWSLPRRQQVNIVVGRESRAWSKRARVPFNILECDDPAWLPGLLGRTARRMLSGCRYLGPRDLGRDILLQQFVLDWQGGTDNAFGGFNDRDRGFDRLLRVAAQRFERPRIVETGCIRTEEDFRGAGFSTLLLGIFAAGRGGELISVDHEARHCEFARRAVAGLGRAAQVVERDSIEWLGQNQDAIDVLYLDSRDTDQPGCAEHALGEIQAAGRALAPQALVALDDTCYANGTFLGAGALAVPWLLERGWRILYSGHQTILSRTGE